MDDYWDSYTLNEKREEKADAPSLYPGTGDVWDSIPDEGLAPGDLLGRVKRTGRGDGLFGEFSTALEGIKAGPGQAGRGRHNLDDSILSSLMYPFGSQVGNEHARTLFQKSPAAYSWLTGYEAPPLPWGAYKGQGKDLAAARRAKDQGRDLDSFMTRLKVAEAGEVEGVLQAVETPQPVEIEKDYASLASFNAELDKRGDRQDEVEEEDVYSSGIGDETLAGGGGGDSINAEAGKSTYCRPVRSVRQLTPEERDRLMEEAYGYSGMKWEEKGTGTDGKGIDCSRLVGIVHKKTGFNFGSPPSRDLPNIGGGYYFTQVDKPQKGDVVWFDGHVGFYDPAGESKGTPFFSATTSGGVRLTDYKPWGDQPVFLRLNIVTDKMCEPE